MAEVTPMPTQGIFVHDLRNSLNVFRIQLALMKNKVAGGTTDPGGLNQNLRQMDQEVDRLESLVRTMFKHSHTR